MVEAGAADGRRDQLRISDDCAGDIREYNGNLYGTKWILIIGRADVQLIQMNLNDSGIKNNGAGTIIITICWTTMCDDGEGGTKRSVSRPAAAEGRFTILHVRPFE